MSSLRCSTSRSKKMDDVGGLKICSLPKKFYPYPKNFKAGLSLQLELACLNAAMGWLSSTETRTWVKLMVIWG